MLNKKNKKGWIRIVEAFISVLLVAGVLLTLINTGMIGKSDISENVYNSQTAILREIELDDSLRAEILDLQNNNLPIRWEDFDTYGLNGIKLKIEQRKPEYLNCTAKVCALNEICELDKYEEGDVYAQSVAITANIQNYKPRQLKMFCTPI